jgi:hemerythrin-like domain-containing protein
MSVLDTLAAEHALFERLLREFKEALRYDPDTARRQLRDTLLVLIPALESHEELEDLIFGRAAEKGGRHVFSELSREHRRIDLLRRELVDAMRDASECPFDTLKELILQLTARVRQHFLVEELRLWPRYRELVGRSISRSLERRAQDQFKRLVREMERRKQMTADLAGRTA